MPALLSAMDAALKEAGHAQTKPVRWPLQWQA
jgi:hypothetical protein